MHPSLLLYSYPTVWSLYILARRVIQVPVRNSEHTPCGVIRFVLHAELELPKSTELLGEVKTPCGVCGNYYTLGTCDITRYNASMILLNISITQQSGYR